MPDRLKVTVSDVVTGEVLGERVIYDDYVLVCAGHVYLSAVQQHGNGTHQLTVKNCGAPSLSTVTWVECSACHGSALVALCGRIDADSDGPCVLRGGHFGPCWGEGDVASDWSPMASCRKCCVCTCGSFDASRDDGSECPDCHEAPRPGFIVSNPNSTERER